MVLMTALAYGKLELLEPKPHLITGSLKAGLIFIKEDEFLLSGDKWTISLDVDLGEYESSVSKAVSEINLIQQVFMNQTHLTRAENATLSQLRAETRLLVSDALLVEQAFSSLLGTLTPHSRKERGLINLGGSALKFLFGTLDNGDLQALSHRIDGVAGDSKKILHLLHEQTTIVSQVVKMGQRFDKGVHTLENATRLVNARLDDLRKELQHKQRDTSTRLEIYAAVTSSLREVEYTLNAVKEDVLALTAALQDTALGKLSPYFLSPPMLLTVCIRAQTYLPVDVTFLTELHLDMMYLYYNMVQVTATLTPQHSLRLFIEIPLRAPNRVFGLYRAWPLPTPLGNHSAAAYIKPAFPYLAITQDQQAYLELDSTDLRACKKNVITVCPPQKPVRNPSQRTCLYSLFIGDVPKIQQVCDRRIIKDPQPVLYRPEHTNQWIYSTGVTHLVVKCATANSTTIEKQVIRGTGIISIPPTCYVHHTDFTLLPHFTQASPLESIHPSFHIPVFQELIPNFNFSIDTPMVSDSQSDTVSKLLDSIRHDSDLRLGVSLQEFQGKITEVEEAPQIKIYTHYLPNIGLAGAALICVGILYVCRGPIIKCCKKRAGNRRSPPKPAFQAGPSYVPPPVFTPQRQMNTSPPRMYPALLEIDTEL